MTFLGGMAPAASGSWKTNQRPSKQVSPQDRAGRTVSGRDFASELPRCQS